VSDFNDNQSICFFNENFDYLSSCLKLFRHNGHLWWKFRQEGAERQEGTYLNKNSLFTIDSHCMFQNFSIMTTCDENFDKRVQMAMKVHIFKKPIKFRTTPILGKHEWVKKKNFLLKFGYPRILNTFKSVQKRNFLLIIDICRYAKTLKHILFFGVPPTTFLP
jgi:hypothetical protein